ncbi:hypothetical protein [Desulfonema ishimotonii]|uniref:hypothetical protein n=1 Tax=Desulfonema ishimotonii TaxID=45657 RepID=UPI000F586DCB|nr:hypothetical protein [Desulfonema ishimotonii]
MIVTQCVINVKRYHLEAVLKIPAAQKRSAKIKAEGRFFANFAKDRPFRGFNFCTPKGFLMRAKEGGVADECICEAGEPGPPQPFGYALIIE